MWFTFWQASASTLLTVLVALPLSAVVANVRFPGRSLVKAIVMVPFVLPTVVVAGAFLATAERLNLESGPFALKRSVFAILAAHAFFNVAVVVRTVGGYWTQLSRDDERAARVLGSRPAMVFLRITLRRLMPALSAAVSIVFLFTFTSFGVVLILGGLGERTIETEIFRYALVRSDFASAAALSVVQLVAVALLVVLNMRLRSRLPRNDRVTMDRATRPDTTAGRVMAATVVIATFGLLFTPIAALVEQSFRNDSGWTLAHYRNLVDRPPFLTVTPARAVLNSLMFASVATAIAALAGGWASLVIVYGRRLMAAVVDFGYLLPLGTSAVTLGLGVLISFDSGRFDIRDSWIIIPLVQSLIGIPFVTRSVVPVLRAINPNIREAAAGLGATPTRVRRDIDLPIARRALIMGAGFAFAISLGEFGATSFVGRRPDLMTMPLAIDRLLGQPGDAIRGQAMAMSVLLMLVTTIVLLVVDRGDAGRVV